MIKLGYDPNDTKVAEEMINNKNVEIVGIMMHVLYLMATHL